ncbi:MAG TPA: MJ0042-type zinc finger domain-containing protein [Gemmataceae bacterium]|nr:MJ0042-type zinc finger domain-containing protein [Gemmataceae bacterium]
MPIVIDCPSCSRRLRVPDDLLGARVKCPTCGSQFTAASGEAAPPVSGPTLTEPSAPRDASPSPDPGEAPSTPAPLGDVSIKPSLEDAPPSQPTEQEPQETAAKPADSERRHCPYCGEEITQKATRCPYCNEDLHPEEDDRPWEHYGRYGIRRDWEPHRGTLVLVLGILSLVAAGLFFLFCWALGLPLGIAAWVIGHRDLKKMQANLMDPEGRGLTQGGWICGIIGTILNTLFALGCIGYFVVMGLMVYTANRMTTRQIVPPPPPPPPPKKIQSVAPPLRLVDYLPGK